MGRGRRGRCLLRAKRFPCPLSPRPPTPTQSATNLSDRLRVGKLLSLLVPARVLTLEQLRRGVGDLMSLYDDLVTDFPKADVALGDLCGNGLACGTLRPAAFASTGPGLPGHDAVAQAAKGYVPAALIHAKVAARIAGLADANTAGSQLAKPEGFEDGEGGGAGEGAAAAEVPPAAAAAAAPVPVAAPAPAGAPAAAPADDDDDDGAPKLVAKKKKKKLVLADDDE